MEANLFDNEQVLAWLRYFMENANLDLARVKILDITRKNKNLLPTVLSNRSVLVFTDAGHPQIFYDLWDAGLGSCEIWYNEGSEPGGPHQARQAQGHDQPRHQCLGSHAGGES